MRNNLRHNPRLSALLMLVVSSALCLVALELVAQRIELRAVRRRAPATRLSLLQANPNGTGSYRMKPNLDLKVSVKGLNVHIQTNSHGMRWRETSRLKPAGVTRIAFLGDSFTFGCWSDSIESSFVGVFERGMGRPRYEALNFGIGGYGLDDMELLLHEQVAAFAPDYVVVMLFTGNDIRDTYLGLNKYDLVDGTVEFNRANMAAKIPAYTHEDEPFNLPEAHDPSAVRRSLARLAAGRLALRSLGLANPWLNFKPSRHFTSFSFWCQHPYPDVARRAIDVTLATLDRVNASVAEHGGRLAVVAIPSREQVYLSATAGRTFDTALPQAYVLPHARERGIPYLDLLPPLRAYATRHWGSVYVDGDIHFNTTGHRLTGEWLREWFAESVVTRASGARDR